MASGNTTTAALADSLPTVIASARAVREYEGSMSQLVDQVTLEEGTGQSWNEVSMSQLTATAVTETTDLDNPQLMVDTLFTITPTQIGIQTFITLRVAARIAKVAYAKLGSLAQNAIQRKKDEDGLVALDGATTSLCGAGTTLNAGHIDAAAVRITSNATEPGKPPLHGVLHGYQLKDLADELRAGVGTYPIDKDGITARVYRDGFRGVTPVSGVRLFEDGNITIDGSSDAKGGVFAKEALVLVQGMKLRHYTQFKPNLGGGGTAVWIYDEYAYGERSPGNWLFEEYSDATAPTN